MEEEKRTYEISLIGPGQVLVGAGAGILSTIIIEEAVGDGPITRSTSRLEQGQNANNKELFPYDTGMEVAGAILAGALFTVKVINMLKRKKTL